MTACLALVRPVSILLLSSTLVIAAAASGCGGAPPPESARPTPRAAALAKTARADSVVLVTIDTLRADRVGAYGWHAARTPAIDGLATRGLRAERAYATAPITLTSHASLLTGLYPPRHGARHNGMRVRPDVPTLAEMLRFRGFATGAFVAAFPLDHRFGLDRGFDVYSDALPRGPDGRPLNERPGSQVMDEALAWMKSAEGRPFFMWVHLFEPHAPYEADPSVGDAPATRSVSDRYDDEIARADAQVARLVGALGPRAASTLIVVAGDHGEAFGEHGEIGHSVFVYDTTLRVPLVLSGPGVDGRGERRGAGLSRGAGGVVTAPVSLVDVVPTVVELLGLPPVQIDGTSLVPVFAGGSLGDRTLYAESFAPLLDFGWSPLRALRSGGNKYIAAPKAELYDLAGDPTETRNLLAERPDVVKTLADRIERISPADLELPAAASKAAPPAPTDSEAIARLRSLGYLASSKGDGAATAPPARPGAAARRPDPKDRVELASRIAEITSGELQGPALRTALERIVREDPRNGQMQMRLGFALLEGGACGEAVPHFAAAIAASVPSAEPNLGMAECLRTTGQRDAARRALLAAERIEPGNPVVAANLGMMSLDDGKIADAIAQLRATLVLAPDLHQARFALARAYGRAGQRDDAAREARDLLARLPPDAPQRAEVERLLAAVQ